MAVSFARSLVEGAVGPSYAINISQPFQNMAGAKSTNDQAGRNLSAIAKLQDQKSAEYGRDKAVTGDNENNAAPDPKNPMSFFAQPASSSGDPSLQNEKSNFKDYTKNEDEQDWSGGDPTHVYHASTGESYFKGFQTTSAEINAHRITLENFAANQDLIIRDKQGERQSAVEVADITNLEQAVQNNMKAQERSAEFAMKRGMGDQFSKPAAPTPAAFGMG